MEELLVLIVLVQIGGWILGVVGFFKARSARAELAELRRAVEALGSAEPQPAPAPFAPPEAAPMASPPVADEPAAEPVVPETVLGPPAPEPEPVSQRPDIEALLTARWGVWLGAAALVLAGVFLVRYAVDEGLLGPAPRCVLAGLLGVAL